MLSVLSELRIINSKYVTEAKEIIKKAEEISKLLRHYENSSDFEGWYPDWLWERRKKCFTKLAVCNGNILHIEKLMLILQKIYGLMDDFANSY